MKNILITGSSRGIGAEIARYASSLGYNVAVNYLNSADRAKTLKSEIESNGVRCVIVKCDVSDEVSVDNMYNVDSSALGHIEVVVNNAAVSSFSLFTDNTSELWKRTFDINVGGAFLVTKCFLPDMIHNKSGKIINISSVWGITGASCEVHYSATKAAIIGMTKALAKELGPSGITVNCVAPGVIDTEMNSQLSCDDIQALMDETPLGKIGTVSDVAKTVMFLASSDADFITGQVISPNGGFLI